MALQPPKPKPKERLKIQEVVLGVLGIGALLTVLFIAPNAVQIVDMFGRKKIFPRKQFRDTVTRMEKKGFLRRRSSDKTCWKFSLTSGGNKILRKQNIEKLAIGRPRQWDGKWRLVIFDIPETLKSARHAFRWKLKHLGFHYLNLSVWVFPFECRDEINAITEYYNVGKYVRHVLVENFDGEDSLRTSFSL